MSWWNNGIKTMIMMVVVRRSHHVGSSRRKKSFETGRRMIKYLPDRDYK